jgi:hypothetical protein
MACARSKVIQKKYGPKKLSEDNSCSTASSYLDHIGRGMLKKGRGAASFRTEKIRTDFDSETQAVTRHCHRAHAGIVVLI